jgi:hypothetical protein
MFFFRSVRGGGTGGEAAALCPSSVSVVRLGYSGGGMKLICEDKQVF